MRGPGARVPACRAPTRRRTRSCRLGCGLAGWPLPVAGGGPSRRRWAGPMRWSPTSRCTRCRRPRSPRARRARDPDVRDPRLRPAAAARQRRSIWRARVPARGRAAGGAAVGAGLGVDGGARGDRAPPRRPGGYLPYPLRELPAAAPQPRPRPGEPLRVAWVGRLAAEKDPLTAVRAVERLLEHGPPGSTSTATARSGPSSRRSPPGARGSSCTGNARGRRSWRRRSAPTPASRRPCGTTSRWRCSKRSRGGSPSCRPGGRRPAVLRRRRAVALLRRARRRRRAGARAARARGEYAPCVERSRPTAGASAMSIAGRRTSSCA